MVGEIRNAGQAVNIDAPAVLFIAPRHSVDRFRSFGSPVSHIS